MAALILLLVLSLVISIPHFPLVSTTEDSWATKESMQVARGRLGVAVVNGKIYAIGGDTLNLSGFRNADFERGSPVSTNEEYDPATDTWTFKEPMPTPRSHFGIAVYQNRIYCIGGYTEDGITGLNEVYDPETDTWETKTAMPTARNLPHTNFVNDKIYAIGGRFATFNYSRVNEVYDPVRDSWITKTAMPQVSLGFASSAVVDNRIYVMGGWSGVEGTNANLTQIYDTKTDSWSFGAPQPSGVIQAGVGVTTGMNAPKQIYFFVDSLTQVYNPANDSWAHGTGMSTARGYAGVAVINDIFYVIGGMLAPYVGSYPFDSINTKSTGSNEQYTPIGYIPEFPSWTPMLLILIMLAVAVAIYKRKLPKTGNTTIILEP